MGRNLPFTAAWDEDEPDDISFGPYLGNLREEPPKPRQRKSAVPVYDRGPSAKPKRPATDRQVKLAEWISETLGRPMPSERTRQSLFLFIRDNKAEFDRRLKRDRPVLADSPEPIDDADYWAGYDMCGLDPYTGGFADND